MASRSPARVRRRGAGARQRERLALKVGGRGSMLAGKLRRCGPVRSGSWPAGEEMEAEGEVIYHLNNAALSSGGAIHSNGTTTVIRTTISDNAVSQGAGGAIVATGSFEILQSTISGNSARGAGGAIFTTVAGGSRTIANSTLSGNESQGTGGGIQTNTAVSLTNVTIAENHGTTPGAAPGVGAGIFTSNGTVTLTNTLLAEQVNGSNCSGNYVSVVGNLDDHDSCPATATDASPGLGPLTSNGGTTETHALSSVARRSTLATTPPVPPHR